MVEKQVGKQYTEAKEKLKKSCVKIGKRGENARIKKTQKTLRSKASKQL